MFALAACGGPPNAADATTAQGAGQAAAEPVVPPEPWRYGPALAGAVPPGQSAAPVLELADGLRGRARIVVAVAAGEAPVRLEIWDFSQNNERGVLARVGEPVVLLDMHDADAPFAADAVADLRREIASPGNEAVRPLGLPGEPTTLPAELARLAAACTGTGDAATRTHALAQLIRGLDDRLVWEEARLPELLKRLRAGPWTVGEATPVGARRLRLAATEGDRQIELELARTQDRWALVAVKDRGQSSAAPAADPSPTAP